MEPRKYQLAEIATYAYCSMQYHLRFRAGVPWAVTSPEVAFSTITREVIREYFRCIKVQELRKRARRNMEGLLDIGMSDFEKHFPRASARRRRIDLILAMRDAEQLFVPGRDRPIGFDIEATVGIPSDGVILVSGKLDFGVWRHAGTPMEVAVGVSVVSVEDPLEDLVNLEPLHAGFGVMAMREGEKYDVPAIHETVPFLKPSKKFGTVRKRTQGFQALVRSVDRGIRNNVFVPQSSPVKCEHCPYAPICTPALAEEKKIDWKPEVDNPFVGWPGSKL